MTLIEGSLCTGYNGFGLAVRRAFGDVAMAFVADKDLAAAKLLAHRYPDVPNLGDITAVDWTRVPRVDILTAGYPCQGESLAGKRRGVNDERWVWDDVFAAIRDLRPGAVFLENVPGHLSLGFGRVLGDLASIGFDAQWMCLRASDIGAAHRRERVFIYAWPADAPRLRLGNAGKEGGKGIPAATVAGVAFLPTPVRSDAKRSDSPAEWARKSPNLTAVSALFPTPAAARSGRQRSASDGAAIRPSLDMIGALLPTPRASPNENRQTRRTPSQEAGAHGLSLAAEICTLPTPRATRGGSSTEIAHLLPTPRATDGVKGGPNQRGSSGDLMLPAAVQPERWGRYAPAIQRWADVIDVTPPEPTQQDKKGPRLSPRFVEWLMGLPAGWVTGVPGLSRNDELRLLGNGLMPQQGAQAIRHLHSLAVTA